MTAKQIHEATGLNVRKMGNGKYVGMMRFRQSYFYHRGRTSEQFATGVATKLAKAGINAKRYDDVDDYNAWPKSSYFVAYFKIEEV